MEPSEVSADGGGEAPRLCPLTTTLLTDLIMGFVTAYNEPAGIHLYSYQRIFMRRIVKSILTKEGATITGLWSRQSGKSEALSSLASALCIILPVLCRNYPDDPRLSQYKEGFWIGIFAPKQQQSGIIYDRIRKRAERESSLEIYSDPDIEVMLTQSRGDQVSWSNGSFVIAQTASEQSNVEGKTFHLVIIDEAQLVGRAKIKKEIRPMLAATNGTMVEIGTANALRGDFKEKIIANIDYERQGGPKNHFEFPYDKVIAEKRRAYQETKNDFHLNYENWVKEELRGLGGNIDNEEFRMNFRLIWAEVQSGAIDHAALEDAADYTLEAGYPVFNKRCVAGLDYGKKRDVTVLTIYAIDDKPVIDERALVRPGDNQPLFYHKTIIAWYKIKGRKWNDILGRVVEAVQYFSIDTIVCDGTGIGDPLTEQLQALCPSVQIIPFIMSHIGNDKAFKLYIQEIEAGRISYAAGVHTQETEEFQDFVHEHEVLIKDRVGVYIKCYAPEGDHDDFPDSAALGCIATTYTEGMMQEIESSPNPFYGVQKGYQVASGRASRYLTR